PVSNLAGQRKQLAEGKGALCPVFAHPDQSPLIGPTAISMPVETVHGNVDLPIHKPLCFRFLTLQHARPRFYPGKFSRDLIPESLEIAGCLVIESLVILDIGCR